VLTNNTCVEAPTAGIPRTVLLTGEAPPSRLDDAKVEVAKRVAY